MKTISTLQTRLALIASFTGCFLATPSAWALHGITRPYQGIRSAGMGGVRMTTGLYDENFFGNPARNSANPRFKIELFDFMAEVNTGALKSTSGLTSGGDILEKIGDTAGTNNHVRFQTSFPAIYWPNVGGGKWSYSFGVLMSAQTDLDLRRSYSADTRSIIDLGPAMTISRKLNVGAQEDALAVGVTPHLSYRISTQEDFSLVDFVKGSSISPLQSGGDGTHIDFDIGGTYNLPVSWFNWDWSTGFAVNNILDGRYSNIDFQKLTTHLKPVQQPRSFGGGIRARKAELWKFSDVLAALELTDIGNNTGGSWFKTLHIGGEARYGILAPRLGINQGYWCLGLGLDLKIFTLDLATYGEEMGLNVGSIEDRRIALRLAFQI